MTAKELAKSLLDKHADGRDTDWAALASDIEAALIAVAAAKFEACAKWLDAEAAMWVGDEEPCGAAIWKELTSAAAHIRRLA